MKIKYMRSICQDELIRDGVIYIKANSAHTYIRRKCIANNEIVVIEEGVTNIDKYTFSNVRGIKEIHLPSTLEEIGEGAFHNCCDLEVVRCKSPIVKVKKEAFIYDSKLKEIDMYMDIAGNDIKNLFGCYRKLERPIIIPTSLQKYKLAKVFNGALTRMEYHRDETKSSKTEFTTIQEEPETLNFDEETRQVF